MREARFQLGGGGWEDMVAGRVLEWMKRLLRRWERGVGS